MTCSPDKCPHRALLEKARAACLKCEHTTPSAHGGMVSAEASGENIIRKEMIQFDRSPRGQVTTLPPEVEEAVKEFLCYWCSMDTMGLLVLHHMATGGKPETFANKLKYVREMINGMNVDDESFRATAWQRWQSIVRSMPVLESVKAWSKGHGGAYRDERKAVARLANENRQPYLSEEAARWGTR